MAAALYTLTSSPKRSPPSRKRSAGTNANNNADRLQTWLDAIAKDNPAKAFTLFLSVIEYRVPELSHVDARTKETIIVQLPKFGSKTADLEFGTPEFAPTTRRKNPLARLAWVNPQQEALTAAGCAAATLGMCRSPTIQ